MFHGEKESKTLSPRQRELVVLYLSYALEDVRALSEMGSHFLQMTIATITEETSLDTPPVQPLQSTTPH
jgi:alkylhydroperoxidase/carboxymuconolactone decarboxylase family protein YurZ